MLATFYVSKANMEKILNIEPWLRAHKIKPNVYRVIMYPDQVSKVTTRCGADVLTTKE